MSRSLQTTLLAGLVAFCVLWGLSFAPFINPDEGRYSSASYEMVHPFSGSPDWVVPHLNTITRLNKPPLVYWLAGGAFKIFGVHEWSGRLSPALASLLIAFVLYLWGTRVFSRRAGAAAALVWATAAFPAAMGRTLNTDMLLASAITLASFGLFWMLEGRHPIRFALISGIGLGLALLAKGPVGLALPLVGIGFYSLGCQFLPGFKGETSAVQAPKQQKALAWGVAIGLALLIALPWYIAAQIKRPDFFDTFIIQENFGRFSGKENFHDPTPKWFYLPVIIVGFLPWSAFLIPTFSRVSRENLNCSELMAKRSRLFLWLWAVGVTAFFSLSGTKLISYVLPAFPPLALLIGARVANWENVSRRVRGWTLGVWLLLSLVLIIAISGYPKKDKVTHAWKIAPGALLDDKTLPYREGLPWVAIVTAVLGGGGAGILLAQRRPNGRNLLIVQGATSTALVVVLLALAGNILKYEDGSAVLVALEPRLQPSDEIVNYRCFIPTTMLYGRRPGTFFFFKNTSGLNQAELDASPYFFQLKDPEKNDLMGWMKGRTNRVFVISRGFLDENLRPNFQYWGRTNDFFLYSNQPKPADFVLESVAPKKVDNPVILGVPSKDKD